MMGAMIDFCHVHLRGKGIFSWEQCLKEKVTQVIGKVLGVLYEEDISVFVGLFN